MALQILLAHKNVIQHSIELIGCSPGIIFYYNVYQLTQPYIYGIVLLAEDVRILSSLQRGTSLNALHKPAQIGEYLLIFLVHMACHL